MATEHPTNPFTTALPFAPTPRICEFANAKKKNASRKNRDQKATPMKTAHHRPGTTCSEEPPEYFHGRK